MQFPLTTGLAARLLGTTEPKLAEAVRRGHVLPEPPVVAGRRLWSPTHVRMAAIHFGLLTPNVERQLASSGEEVAGV